MNTRDVYINTTELNGEKMNPKEIRKWLKQAIKAPGTGTYHELINQANIFVSSLEILGGDECYCIFKVKHFIKVMKNLKKKIESENKILENKKIFRFRNKISTFIK